MSHWIFPIQHLSASHNSSKLTMPSPVTSTTPLNPSQLCLASSSDIGRAESDLTPVTNSSAVMRLSLLASKLSREASWALQFFSKNALSSSSERLPSRLVSTSLLGIHTVGTAYKVKTYRVDESMNFFEIFFIEIVLLFQKFLVGLKIG